MDNRELVSFNVLVNSLDTEYGKRTPTSLATVRVEPRETMAVLFKNREATVSSRLLLDRLARDHRKVRIFLEPGDVITLSRKENGLDRTEYFRAEKGNRKLRLISIAPPDISTPLDEKIFHKLEDARLSWAIATSKAVFKTLINHNLQPFGKISNLAGVNLIFEENLQLPVEKRCTWFMSVARFNSDNTLSRCVGANNIYVAVGGDLELQKVVLSEMPLDDYIVGLDSDTGAIRVLCHPEARETILQKLRDANIYSLKSDTVYKLLLDVPNDLVKLGFDEVK